MFGKIRLDDILNIALFTEDAINDDVNVTETRLRNIFNPARYGIQVLTEFNEKTNDCLKPISSAKQLNESDPSVC